MAALLVLLRKGTASVFNMVLIEAVTFPFDSHPLTVVVFFVYSFGMDAGNGRCLGMIIAGSRWQGDPTWRQKLVYSLSYSVFFALALCGPLPFVLAGTVQIVSQLATGKTTHGLLAGMNSQAHSASIWNTQTRAATAAA